MYTHNETGKASRSGKQHTYTGEGYDSWKGLSPNGRQYKNEDTMLSRNLSGSDYWHMRKEMSPDLREKDIISADDYPIPSYYHKKEPVVKTEIVEEIVEEIVAEGVVKTKDSFTVMVVVLCTVIACSVLYHIL